MSQAVLPSNRGDDRLTLSFGSRFEWQGQRVIEAVLQLEGEHFDGDHDHDLRVMIEGLALAERSLASLSSALDTWLSLPLEQLHSGKLRSKHSLSLGARQRLDLTFGEREDTISGRQPVVTVDFAAGRLLGEHHFVTDQSCIRLFNEQLALILAEPAG
jgi:hypothetical protein